MQGFGCAVQTCSLLNFLRLPQCPGHTRHMFKAGITGWAQVNGWRGYTDTEEKLRRRVEFDFDYIRNCSFLRDLEILMRTVPSVLAPPPDNA